MKQGDTAYVVVGKLYLSVAYEAIYRAELVKKNPKSYADKGWKIKYTELVWAGENYKAHFDIGDTINVGAAQVFATLVDAVERAERKLQESTSFISEQITKNDKVRGDLLKLKMVERSKKGMR
jgi:hypothetical protein